MLGPEKVLWEHPVTKNSRVGAPGAMAGVGSPKVDNGKE